MFRKPYRKLKASNCLTFYKQIQLFWIHYHYPWLDSLLNCFCTIFFFFFFFRKGGGGSAPDFDQFFKIILPTVKKKKCLLGRSDRWEKKGIVLKDFKIFDEKVSFGWRGILKGQVFPPFFVVFFDPKRKTELNGNITSLFHYNMYLRIW